MVLAALIPARRVMMLGLNARRQCCVGSNCARLSLCSNATAAACRLCFLSFFECASRLAWCRFQHKHTDMRAEQLHRPTSCGLAGFISLLLSHVRSLPCICTAFTHILAPKGKSGSSSGRPNAWRALASVSSGRRRRLATQQHDGEGNRCGNCAGGPLQVVPSPVRAVCLSCAARRHMEAHQAARGSAAAMQPIASMRGCLRPNSGSHDHRTAAPGPWQVSR